MADLLMFDIRTIISVLFWGNLISTILIYIYSFLHEDGSDKKYITKLFTARYLETFFYLLIFFKGSIVDILTINISMSMLFYSLYLNGYLMLVLSNNADEKRLRNLRIVLVSSLVAFNIATVLLSYQMYLVVAAICMLAILVMPSLRLIFSKDMRRFTHITGSVYALFLLMASLRSLFIFVDEGCVFTDSIIQALTFLSQYLSVVFSAPAMLLIFKDRNDKNYEHLASIDGLTGIPNRVSFLKETRKYLSDSKDLEHNISILFLDIDFFKKINDTYGHVFGDEVLIKFASILEKNTRKDDMSCRYGGEEFLIIMRNSSEASALSLAERIMKQIRELRFESQPDFCFTVSIGIYSGCVENGHTLDSYIDKADKAMYVAKNTGRDRIVVYSEELEQ